MGPVDTPIAAITFTICVVLIVRLMLGSRRRARFDAFVKRSWYQLVWRFSRLRQWRRTPGPRTSKAEAERTAAEAIERAKRGSWNGNVYSPKSFRKPRKPH